MHKREFTKPTATAPLALEALENSELYLHGKIDSPLNLEHLKRMIEATSFSFRQG